VRTPRRPLLTQARLGRDYDLLRIERALRDADNPWVLLTGVGGIGKTELAYGFARWYAETGGCPGGVYAASFKEKADLGQVIGSIVGYGTDFSSLPHDEQWRQLIGYLRDNACLLVWDNVETVAGYPEGADALASDDDRADLARFAQALRGGKSRLLITSRKPDEPWLGVAPGLIEMTGLTARDAAQMAQAVLRTVGRRPAEFRDDPRYTELIDLLRGHPRSLEIVLPNLRRTSPAEVIAALQHRVDHLGEALQDASFAYAYSQMSPRTRTHLPLLGLFATYVHAEILAAFVQLADQREGAYTEIMGEALDADGWEAILVEASRSGLLRSLGNRIYELPPTLPPLLRRELVARVGAGGLARLDAEYRHFYATWAGHYDEKVTKGDRNAMFAVTIEEANLLRALRLAGAVEAWAAAQAIAQTLSEFYRLRGRNDEWAALRARLLGRVGREITTDADGDRAALWRYLFGDAANDALRRNDLARAEAAHQAILEYLTSLDDPALEPQIAVAYHQLGIVAYLRQRFNDAERWYRQALKTFERLGLEGQAATVYHQLGRIAEERTRFDDAERWYRQALEIRERLGLERDAADVYHQLGIVAGERGQLDDAERWYRQALEIRERLGLERDAADVYHQLGIVAQERAQLDDAERWYRQALEIRERLGLERDAADEYHQLGRVAQERTQLDDAERWYRQGLEIYERLGVEHYAATVYHQLGNVAYLRQQFDDAERWYRQALEIRERLGLERYAADDYHQLGMVAQKRGQLDHAERWVQKALEIRERLGLERDAAAAYHQLGTVAREREEFDVAERWYRQALEIHERRGNPPDRVNTLAQLGVLRRRQGRPAEAFSWYGRALAIATEYEMRVAGQIMEDLARTMQAMGEDPFAAAWRKAFDGQEPPLELLRQILAKMDADSPEEQP